MTVSLSCLVTGSRRPRQSCPLMDDKSDPEFDRIDTGLTREHPAMSTGTVADRNRAVSSLFSWSGWCCWLVPSGNSLAAVTLTIRRRPLVL